MAEEIGEVGVEEAVVPAEGTVLAEATEDTGTEVVSEEGATQEATDGQADEAQSGAPEVYVDFNLPEDITLDSVMLGEFRPLAKELNLSQGQAQQLVDLHTKQMERFATAQAEQWQSVMTGWIDSAKSDKEIGGDTFAANIATARKALDHFGTPELLEAFDVTGVGNHPEFLRVFYRIGKLMEDDTMHFGKSHQQPRTAAEILYPNQN